MTEENALKKVEDFKKWNDGYQRWKWGKTQEYEAWKSRQWKRISFWKS
jgi:hypothetical protein